jgi:hypothetical protein
MATHAPIMGTPVCAPFNPSDWLSRFESLGGGYVLTDSRFALISQYEGAPRDHQRSADMMRHQLTERDRQALADHLRCKRDGEPALASVPDHPDADILSAWERRRAAHARYSALPPCDAPGCAMSPQEAAEWEIIETAEEAIRSAVARTPRGVAIQLWTSLAHNSGSNEADAAIEREDLGFFDDLSDRADWNVRLAVAALRSLKAMEG